MERPPGHVTRWRSTFVLLMCVVVSLTLGCASTESVEPAVPDDELSTTSVPSNEECGAAKTFIYLQPGITTDQIDVIGRALEARGLTPNEFLDEAETYAEFRRLFADQPDLVEDVEPADLPQSFLIASSLDSNDPVTEEIEQLPGVLRVEVTAPTLCQRDGDASTPGG